MGQVFGPLRALCWQAGTAPEANGISCHDADLIIEESSELYFEKLQSVETKVFKLVKKHDPARLFAESAARAIERHLPEGKDSFGSYGEIAKCIR